MQLFLSRRGGHSVFPSKKDGSYKFLYVLLIRLSDIIPNLVVFFPLGS